MITQQQFVVEATRKAVVTLLVAVLAAASASAVQADDRFEPVRELIRDKIDNNGIPSIAVAVAKDGEIVWEQGFGWADRENRIEADADTVYLLASISKSLTATALMTLVQEGKIDLDAPVNDYLGPAKLRSWVGDPNEATVRRVANHTAGLGPADQFFFGEAEAALVPPMDTVIARYGHIVQPPAQRYAYSNLGYSLLGHVVERVSGQSFADYMREEVFLPLGMQHTSVGFDPGLGTNAVLYGLQGERIPLLVRAGPSAGDIRSSARDLLRFGMFLAGQSGAGGGRPILDAVSLQEMRRPTSNMTESGYGYGIGLHTVETWPSGPRGFEHGGSMTGSSTLMTILPEQGLVVAVLSNRWHSQVGEVRDAIVRAMLPDWPVHVRSEGKTDAARPAPSALPTDWQGDWCGTLYTHEREIPVALKVLPSGEVHVQIDDQLWGLLNEAAFEDGTLKGRSPNYVPVADTERRRHDVRLELARQGDLLTGMVTAGVGPKFPVGDRDYPYFVYALHYRVELRRATDSAAEAATGLR